MSINIAKVAAMFGKSESFTKSVIQKYGVTEIPKFRHPDDGLDGFYSEMTSYYSEEPSMTRQEFTDQCDPNNILDRVARGQDISLLLSKATPQYGDFTVVPESYHSAMNTLVAANQAAANSFAQLDPKIRERFGNDPMKLANFLSNVDNSDEAIRLGLAVAKPQDDISTVKKTVSAGGESAGGGEGA